MSGSLKQHHPNEPDLQNQNAYDTQNNSTSSTGPISNTYEEVYVPVEQRPTTKVNLQLELLLLQIEYTKREIYNLELTILEKERSLLLSSEENMYAK